MFTRYKYLDQLLISNDLTKIKVLVGPNNCGKATILEQLRTVLRRNGTTTNQIHLLRSKQSVYSPFSDSTTSFSAIKAKLIHEKMNYLFMDELDIGDSCLSDLSQLLKLPNIDIYLTTASAKTILTLTPLKGHCRFIPVTPLSFNEYVNYHHWNPTTQRLYQYLNEGGFPFSQEIHNINSRLKYLRGVINTIIINNLGQHNCLCQPALTFQLAQVLIANLGHPVNTSQLVTQLQARGIKTSNKTVSSYLKVLQEMLLFIPCYEYDLATHQKKSTNVKYYPIDPSLRPLLTSQANQLSGINLEMLIFLELYSWGYQINSGRYGHGLTTFIASKGQIKFYLQFVYSLANQAAYQRIVTKFNQHHEQFSCLLIIAKKPSFLLQADPQLPIITITDWLMQSK